MKVIRTKSISPFHHTHPIQSISPCSLPFWSISLQQRNNHQEGNQMGNTSKKEVDDLKKRKENEEIEETNIKKKKKEQCESNLLFNI
jgi:hypothetical protein